MDSVKDGLEKSKTDSDIHNKSLRQRLITADVFVPITALLTLVGGIPFVLFVGFIICVAAWEIWRIFKSGGYSPSLTIMIAFSAILVVMRFFFGLDHIDIWIAALLIVAAFAHTLQQQRSEPKTASNLAITVFGTAYVALLGSYAISIRFMEHGLLWSLLVFPIISIADAGAYFTGWLFGKHKMLKIVSPKKSWEGYFGGIVIGALGGWGLAALWNIASPGVLPIHGLLLGLVISIICPFGDFGESMIKRQFGVKDSSNLLPGHGGFFDRIDSSLWAAFIGYYAILLIQSLF